MGHSLNKIEKKILNEYYEKRNPSYSEIAKNIGVSRATVYRKMKKLEKQDKIKRGGVILPNYNALGFSFIAIGLSVPEEDEEKTIKILKNEENVSLLFRAYMDHNIISLLLCEEGEEGKISKEIKKKLKKENIEVIDIDISANTSIEKINFLPHFK